MGTSPLPSRPYFLPQLGQNPELNTCLLATPLPLAKPRVCQCLPQIDSSLLFHYSLNKLFWPPSLLLLRTWLIFANVLVHAVLHFLMYGSCVKGRQKSERDWSLGRGCKYPLANRTHPSGFSHVSFL